MPNPRRKKDEEKEQSSSSSSRVIKPSQKFAEWYNAGAEENALRNLAADMARARLNDPAIQQRNAWLREMEDKQRRLNADISAYNDNVRRQNSAAALSNSLARGAYLGAAQAAQPRRSLSPSDLASVAGMVAKGNRDRAADNYMSVVRNNFEVPDNGGNVRTYDWRYRNENWSRNIPDGGDRIREQYERDVADWKKTNEAVDNYNAWVAQRNGKPYEGNGDPSKGLQSYLYLQNREEQRIADIERDQGINSLNRSYAFPDGGERSKAAYADFIEAMKRANNMAASNYAINEILGRTEEEPGTSMVHYNKYDSMSANAILNEWNRYKEKTAQDLEDAKKLLNITFPGVQSSGMEDIRNRLGALYGIDAYDAGELQSLVDDLEKGKIYLPDGSSTTYSILYNEASSRLPQSDLEEIAKLRAMTSSEIKKQYESQDYTDHDTLQEDKNIVDFLLQNADVMRDYPEGSWEYDARERIRKAYDIDPQDEQALRDLSIKIGVKLINTPKAENNEIAFTDSNGTNYTWRNLYYEAENREQFGKMGNDEEALKLMTNGYALLRQINFYNSGVVDEYTARDALEKSEQLTPQLNSIKDQLSAMGYDFDRMAEYLDTEEAKQDFFMKLEADTAFATEHPGLASLYTVLLMPITSLEGIISLAGGIGSGNVSTPIEEYVPLNYFNNYSTNARDTIRAAAQNEIYNDILENTGNEKFASLVQKLYSGVMSVADSRMSLGLCSALFGPLGNDFVEWASLVMMGSSAAGEEFKQQIETGNDNARTLMVSLAAGINEVLFEKISLDKLMEGREIASWDWGDIAGSAKKIIKQSFVQRGIEGSEEVFTTLANLFAAKLTGNTTKYKNNYDALINSRKVSPSEASRIVTKQFFTDLLTEDFLGGFIAGGGELNYITGAIANSQAARNATAPIVNYQQNRGYRNIGAGFVNNENVGELIKQGQMSEYADTRDLANELARNQVFQRTEAAPADVEKPGVSRKQMKDYKVSLGKLGAAVVKENAGKAFNGNQAALKEAIRAELKNNGIEAKDYIVDVVSQVYNGGELSDYGKNIAESVDADKIVEAVKANAPEIQKEAERISTEAFERVKNVQAMANADYSNQVSKTGEVVDTKTGKAVEIGEFVKDGDNGITLTTKDGGRVSVADLQFANPTQASLYTQVDAAGFNAEIANQVIRGFDGKGTVAVDSYMNGMLEGMAYGRTHQNTDMNFNGPFYADLSASQKDLAIKLGQMERGFDTEKATAKINELKALSGGVRRKGSVTGVPTVGLNDQQRTGVAVLEMLVNNGALTNNFHFFASGTRPGSTARVVSREVAKEIGLANPGNKEYVSAPNGFYVPKTGDIYLDINAGNNGEGTVLFTVAHELTHFVKQWSPNKFNDLANFLVQEYHGAGISVDGLVREQMRKAAASGRKLSYDESFEEMVADSMQTMFTDGDLASKLMALKERDKTLFDKIVDFIRKLRDDIVKAYKNLSPFAKESDAGKALSQISNSINRLADTFAEGITAATENYATVADNMTNEAAFADSDIAIKNQIRTPYTEGTNAWREFIDGLNPEARKTHDLFYNFYTLSRLTNTTNAQGKPVKNINISSVFLTAQQWNEKIAQDKKWNECAKKLAASLPDQVRKNMNFNLDGTLTPVALETRFKMQKSMAQRLVDSLGFETIDNEYELGGKKITLNTAGATQSVGGEAYRRALINETRKLYDAGKLKQVSIHTMSKDRWGSLGFLAANEKTGASGDLTTLCPQMMYNEGCFYCYRRAAMETGVNNKLVAQSVWYTGEILRIKDSDIEGLNEKGGLRIQSFGDWMPHFSAQLADILYDAETRGLQVKIITKEPSMIDYVARLRDQGIGLNLYFNISADYAIEKGPAQLDNFNPDSLARVNPDRPFMRGEDNSFWWKRALAVEEGAALRKKYPWVNVRIVATTQDEFIRGLKDPNVQVVTGYHGNKREWDRVDSTTGEHKVIMEALGDAGMPRFRYENGQWVREYDGKTKTHQALADAIEANGLQQEYYIKTCCITGRCATCQGKCGAYANSFYVKNATNDPQGTAYWYNQMSNVQLEESDAIEIEPSMKQSARDAAIIDREQEKNVQPDDTGFLYSTRITDQDTLDFLDNQKHVTVYRAMQEIDGKLYPPMTAYTIDENGKKIMRPAAEIGSWYQSVERPDLIDPKTGKFKLEKGATDAGKGSAVNAAYNPYFHTSLSILNDQFSSAWDRSNLVVVEGEVPVSELTSGYKAQYAKDAVGKTKWHSGPVATELNKIGKPREVILSRYFKPIRVIGNDEAARSIADTLKGTKISIPENVVSPKLLGELKKLGVNVSAPKGLSQDQINSHYGRVNAPKFSARDSYFDQAYETLPDGRIRPRNVADLSTEDWKTIYQATKKLGYGIKSASEAKQVYGRYVGEGGFNQEQSEALKVAYGVTEQKGPSANPQRVAAAKKEFGVTYDMAEAGYITTDGSMLDFSGKKEGGPAHVRYMDHREINRVFDTENDSDPYNITKYMNAFIAEGNIRLMDDVGVTMGEIEPTPKQYNVLRKFIERVKNNAGAFYLDISNANGNTIAERDYISGETPNKILSEIKEYYKTGELPESPYGDWFRPSLRDPDAMDTRTVLSNALLETAQNDIERKYIEDYQSKIQAMNEEQNRLNEIRNDIRNMTFGKAPHTLEHLKSLKEEATRLANRINIYDKQLLRIEAMKPMQAVIARETDKVKQRIRADQAAFMTDYKNRASAREYIARIEHEVKGLRDRLLHPKAKTIIPESFAKPAAEFLAAIDFSTFNADGTRRAGKANATRAELQSRLDALAKSIDNASLEADYGQLDISPDMKTWIDSVKLYLENNFSADDDYVLRKMDAEQLKDLYKMVVALRTAVNRAGKMYTNMSTNVADLGAGTIDYLEPLFNRERSAAGARVFKTLGWDYAQPVTVFDRFGDSGKQVYKGLLSGQKKEAENVQTILDFVDTAYTRDEINKWRDEMHEVTIGGSKYNVPTSYIQELYCMMKDADAKRHIVEGGGIRFDDLTYGKAGRRKTRTFDNTMISEAEVQAMLNMLTPRQKEVADQMQEFMDRIGADWGNEISMTRFGYHAFGQIPNYYPIRTIKQGSEYEAQQKRANIYALLNKSFTKERVDNANNTVIIGDIFKTFSNHMSEMAVYNAWALPVIDTIKWFNYREAQDLASGTPERSVKDAIRKAYGAEKSNPADEYIRRLLESINSQKSGGLSESLAFHSLRMMNRVAVAANIRVAIQQPFSITRAFEMINPRFVRPMKPNTMRSEYQEMVERTSFGRWKGLGYYDVDISRPLEVEILKNSTVVDRVTEHSMVLAELGDQFTWTTLWHACKLEAQHNGLTGEAMINAAAEKFDEVIARTQVVDSVLTKSQWMRSDSFWHRMTSAFMSEPMTSYNALLRRYDQFQRDLAAHGRAYAWKNNWRKIAGSVALYVLTQVVNAMVTAPIDASRDDDDYKTWFEKMLERFKKNALENIIPTSMMPYISDIAEYAIYGSEDRSDLAMYTKVIDTAKQIYALFDKEKYSVKKLHKAFMSSLSMISSLSGLPMSNALRDAIAIWNTVVGEVIPAETTDYGSWKFQTAEDKNTVGYQQFIKALQDDNEDRAGYIYMQMISNGLDDSGKLNDNILTYYRKNASGDADDTENAAMLNKMMTIFGEDDAEATSEEKAAWWEYTGNNPDTFLADAKAYKHYYEKIMPTGISAEVYNDYRQNLMDNGYNLQAEIIPVIDSLDLTREQKDALYTDNGWTKIGLENTPWHASATPGYGDYTRRAMSENLDNYMSAADYREYLAEIEPYGIDDFTWTNYSNFIKKVKGQDTTGDGKNDYTAQQAVMDYIEALPLTDKQKDALYLKKYSEKNIDKAPWRQ